MPCADRPPDQCKQRWNCADWKCQCSLGYCVLWHEPACRAFGSDHFRNGICIQCIGVDATGKHGVKITVIANDDEGNFPLTALEAAITANTRLIAITHIPSTAGNVLPAIEIGRITRQPVIPIYWMPAGLPDKCPGCTGHRLWSVSGNRTRKFLRGPRGTGFLACKKALHTTKLELMDGFTITVPHCDYTVRNDARRFEWHEKTMQLCWDSTKQLNMY